MGSSHFPAELTDRIIDFCHNDKRTLSNCALTHSSWLAASRFHLFHTITTTGAHEKIGRANRLESIIHERSLALPSRHSSILPYIKTVKIESLVEAGRMARLEDAAYLALTIHRLCNLERLPVPSVHTTLRSFLSQWVALSSLSVANGIVTHVKLSHVTFDDPNDIWLFLTSFPLLQYLKLQSVGFNLAESGFPAGGIFNGVPLTTIRMTTASMGFIIGSLIRVAGPLSHLNDFGITYQDIRQEALPQLADAIQERVKCLRFNASCYPSGGWARGWRPSASDTRIPDLVGRFRSLVTLVLNSLRVDGSDDDHRSDVSFEWIIGVLQQLSSPIQKLMFVVTATECSQLDAIPWASIDAIVHPDAQQFRALVCVEVLVKRGAVSGNRSPSIDKDVVCSEIARRLPGINLLGLLRCNTVRF